MKTIRVVAAVIRKEDMIFATARGYGEYKGRWEFPGGKIEDYAMSRMEERSLIWAADPEEIPWHF